MKNKLLIVFLLLVFGSIRPVLGVGLEPENKLTAEFIPKVTYNKETGSFLYEYTLTNSRESQQSIWNVLIPLKGDLDASSIGDIQGPQDSGSAGGETELGTAKVSWVIVADAPWEDQSQPPPGMLEPGSQLSGFSFKTTQVPSLPTIQDFYARGWVRDITEEEAVEYFSNLAGKQFTNMDEVPDELFLASPLGQPTHERAFRGKTVAPEVVSEDQLQPLPLTERLVSLKDEAASLGWIKSPGIVTSLNQKLKNALKDLEKGNEKAAAGVLKAFLNELDAQRGKHINENAYWLLRANVEFLIDRLK